MSKIVVAVFLFFTCWWIYLHITPSSFDHNQVFGGFYGVIALLGGLYGMWISQKWGGFKSLLGKSIFMFALGLFAQEFGQIVYSVYTFYLHVDIPYPSLGDLGYFGSIPCYILAVWYLAKASGVKIGIQSVSSKMQAIIIPLVLLVISYVLFLRDYQFDWSSPLTIFLDFGYPFGETIYISLAILTYLLTRKVLGGVMKNKVLFILFALVVQFASDYTFLVLSRYGSIAPGGFNDFMYMSAYTLMTLGLTSFSTTAPLLRRVEKN